MKESYKNVLVMLGACVFAFFLAEGVLRALPRRMPAPIPGTILYGGGSPFLYGIPTRYEPKPGAILRVVLADGAEILETLNSEGFRGPEYAIPKPASTFRILAAGDSVVQGFTVEEGKTWERVLERSCREKAERACEVLNAGVGGYVSWQVLERLKRRGLKFQPDVVVLLAGWNDLGYSSRKDWKPGMDLTQLEEAYVNESVRSTPRLRDLFYRYSRVAASIRDFRNVRWNARRIEDLLNRSKAPSGIVFNDAALRLYVENLEKILGACQEARARLAVVLFPALPTPALAGDTEVARKMLVFLENFPLSVPDFLDWQSRYLQAIRDFGAAHPEVTLVDAYGAFQKLNRSERIAAFTDQVHLTPRGNELLGTTVFESLLR